MERERREMERETGGGGTKKHEQKDEKKAEKEGQRKFQIVGTTYATNVDLLNVDEYDIYSSSNPSGNTEEKFSRITHYWLDI